MHSSHVRSTARTLKLLVPPVLAVALVGCATNNPPSTPGVAIGPEGANTTDDLVLQLDGQAIDLDGDPVGLAITWTVDGTPRSDLDGTRLVPWTQTRKGQEWAVVVQASDGIDPGEATSASIIVANAAPRVTLTDVPFAPDATVDVVVQARAEDPDEDAVSLSWSWTVDGEDAGIDGPVVPSGRTARGQVWQVTVYANDGEASGVADTAVIDIANRRPTVSSVTLTPSAAFEDTVLQASAVGLDPDGDDVNVSWTWYVNGVVVDDAGESTLDGASFDRGDAVVAVATPDDGFVEGEAVASPAVEIRNSAPTLSSAVIDQAEVVEGTDVTCSFEGFADADGDPERVRLGWEVDGRLVFEGSILTSAWFDRGDSLVCVATPTDGIEDGRAVRSGPVKVGNALPRVGSVVIDQASPTESDTLTATLSGLSDADGDPVEVRYAWSVGGSVVGTGESLTGASFDKHDAVRVTVTPFDGLEDGSSVTSASVTVRNTPPVVTSITLDPTEVYTDDTITALAEASDVDGDDVDFTYSWSVGGAASPEASRSLPASAFSKGDEIVVTVTPNDGDADGAAETSATLTVRNTPPTFTRVIVSPAAPTEADTLSCVASGWVDPDGDAENYRYRWLVDGVAVSTGATLTGADFDRGDAVSCEATADDLDDDGTVLTAAAIEVRNALPELASVSLDLAAPVEGDTLTATAGATSDADGDPVDVTFAWTIDGVDAGTGSTLDLTGVVKGSVVVVTATPDDGLEDGDAVTASVTVANTAPVVSSVTLAPTSPKAADTLTATVDATDADGDALTTTFAWYVNGTVVGGETGATLSGAFVSGDVVLVEVTANDGDDDSAVVSSSGVTVANTAPSLTGASLDLSVVREGDTVTCVPEGWADADGDAEGYEYLWSTGDTTASIDGTRFDKGDTLSCTVTPDDGTDLGDAVTSGSVIVANTAPTLASVSLDASITVEAAVGFTLGAADDVDGDTISYTYSWLVDGTEVATGTSLDPSAFAKGDRIVLTVTPTDGEDAGTPVSSSAVVVGNVAPSIDSLSLSPESPLTADDLTVTVGTSDLDGDSLTLSYAWTVNGTAASSSTETLAASAFGKGDAVAVTVTADDGTATASLTSSLVTIGNTAPSTPEVALAAERIEDGDDLVCVVTTASTDADGDAITYAIAWTVDGVDFGGTTGTTTLAGDTIAAVETAPDEVWVCSVTADDGTDTSDPGTDSATIDYCTVEILASDSLSIDYDAETVDASDAVLVGYEDDVGASYWTYGWYRFDLSSLDTGAVVREATLYAYATSAADGSPELEVAYSPDDGWDPATATWTTVEFSDTVSAAAITDIPTDDFTEIALSVSDWSYSTDLSDGEVTLGLFSDVDGSLAEFYGPDETGKEPILTLVLESCD